MLEVPHAVAAFKNDSNGFVVVGIVDMLHGLTEHTDRSEEIAVEDNGGALYECGTWGVWVYRGYSRRSTLRAELN